MNAQSRMARTLGCLVAAMTGGTLILHWIQPSAPVANSRYSVSLISLDMKDKVRPDEKADAVRWHGIIVRADRGRTPTRGLAHFRVTPEGRLLLSPGWREQLDAGDPGYIEVIIETDAAGNRPLPSQQADTLLALLNELRDGYITPDATVKLDEQSFAIGRDSKQRPSCIRQIRQLLQASGLTG